MLQSRIEFRHLPDGEYREQRDDRALFDLITQVLGPDSVCIDVGANQGRVLGMMIERAPRGHHIAVEPIPHLAADLRKRFPAVDVHCCALSDQTGQTTFHHVVTMTGWSGLEPPVWCDTSGHKIEHIPVQLRRLDDLVPVDVKVRLLKIDVEGAELHVLRGAEKTIQRCRPVIVFEYGDGHARPYGTTPGAIHDYLTQECRLTVRSLLGRQRRLSREMFVAVCRHATATNYDRASQGNFLATPD
jgi:FkbM family methyltransferase